MAEQIRLEAFWTKIGDAQKNLRKKTWELNIPVQKETTTPIEDLLLKLPKTGSYRESNSDMYIYRYQIDIPGEVEKVTDTQLPQIVEMVQKEFDKKAAEKEAEKMKEKEREIKQRNEKIAKCQDDLRFVFNNEIPLPNSEQYRAARPMLFTLRSFSNGDIGYEYSEPYMFSEFKDDLNLTDKEWEKFRNKLKLDFDQKHDRATRQENETNARLRAEKEAREKAESDFISKWAEENGSDTLKAQLAMGYPGSKLFHEEKLAKDFPKLNVKLRSEASGYDIAVNPTLEQMAVETRAAKAMVKLGLAKNFETAKFMTKVAWAKVDEDDDLPRKHYYVVVEGYRFGPPEIFTKDYTLAILIPSKVELS